MTGLLSVSLSALGYTVLATDIEPTLTEILAPNVRQWMHGESSGGAGRISTCFLDWNLGPDWRSIEAAFSGGTDRFQGEVPTSNHVNESHGAVSGAPLRTTLDTGSDEALPIDLIVSADTVYAVELVSPLLVTISVLSARSPKPPVIYIALERRDPCLINTFFQLAREMGFKSVQVDASRLRKIVEGMQWSEEDWEAVEVWKLSNASLKK
ncbi:uncharacterized protein VP01_1247g3 [Puccinia sorghi]|uniref:Uncharacterized protein n=1 Tax=Puccinia sorghi TaxID=27349 RepID=A0A0L6VPJ0_9BASI|nr:uncharacterized protein VP01_1247g3 [Puccinia sorghi]